MARFATDEYVPKYANDPVKLARRTILVGTINPEGDGSYRSSENELKFQAGFHEHTGVSLHAPMPNNPRGGDTRVPQDTAQSCDCQRAAQPSARMPISAMRCDWYGASRCCSTCWCTRCPWRCSVHDGASALLSLPLASDLSAVGHGQLGLSPWRGAPREVDSHAAETLGRVD